MANVNPGPASTSTVSQTAALANAAFPNFGALGNGQNAFRALAIGKGVPVNATGDTAFLPLINTTAFTLNIPGIILITNPLYLVNGVLTPGTAAALVCRLWSGPAGTGTALCASTTTTTLTGATAGGSQYSIAYNAAAFYNANQWGVGATNGLGGAASYGIYFNVATAAATATQVDVYVYGMDNS